MSPIDIVIVVAVVAVLAVCFRSFAKGKAECADCTAEGCSARNRAAGKCVAAEDMLQRVDKALAESQQAQSRN